MFDRICLINLDNRKDRLGAFRAKVAPYPELHGFVRQRAVHGDTVGVPGFYTAGGGAWGCRQSHLAVLQEAMLDGVESLLVLEDDVCFCPDFAARLAAFRAAVPADWDMLMLGGQNHAPPLPTGTDGVGQSVNTQRTHAYAVRGLEAMRGLYRLWGRCDTHIDHWLPKYQAQFRVYQPDPFLCGQDEGPSDISGRRDPVRFWSRPGSTPPAAGPVYVLTAPRDVADRLRTLGLHTGHTRDPRTGFDAGLAELAAAHWPVDRLRDWLAVIAREAAEAGDAAGVWHDPAPYLRAVEAAAAPRPVVPVAARTVEEGVDGIPELRPAFEQGRVVWAWAGTDQEVVEGLRYHGFHVGHYRDPVTGLDQGVRRAVELGRWDDLPRTVRTLRAEAAHVRRGKVLLVHPALDRDRLAAALPDETVGFLAGDSLGELMAQVAGGAG